MEFAIQINVGQSPQEALESALETMQKHERGEECVVSHLGVLNWKQFYALFSPVGLKLIEPFINTKNEISDESLCVNETTDSTCQSSGIKVSELKDFDAAEYIKDAADVMEYLRLTLEENDPLALADALEVISRSEGLTQLKLRAAGFPPKFEESF